MIGGGVFLTQDDGEVEEEEPEGKIGKKEVVKDKKTTKYIKGTTTRLKDSDMDGYVKNVEKKKKKIVKKTIKGDGDENDDDELNGTHTETKVVKGEDGSITKTSKTTSKKVKKVKKSKKVDHDIENDENDDTEGKKISSSNKTYTKTGEDGVTTTTHITTTHSKKDGDETIKRVIKKGEKGEPITETITIEQGEIIPKKEIHEKKKKVVKKTIKGDGDENDDDELNGTHTETKVVKGEDGSITKTSKTTSKKVKKVKKSKKGDEDEDEKEEELNEGKKTIISSTSKVISSSGQKDDDDDIGALMQGKKTKLIKKTKITKSSNVGDDENEEEIGELHQGKGKKLTKTKIVHSSSNMDDNDEDNSNLHVGKRTVLKSKKKTIEGGNEEILTQTFEGGEQQFEKQEKTILKSKVKKPISMSGRGEEQGSGKNLFEDKNIKDLSTNYSRGGKNDKYQSSYYQVQSIKVLSDGSIQLPHHYRTHPRLYGKDARYCRVCRNTHGLIRKYGLNICRRCFRERYALLGFKTTK